MYQNKTSCQISSLLIFFHAGYFSAEDSSLAKAFLRAADGLPDVRFAHTINDDVKSAMDQTDE